MNFERLTKFMPVPQRRLSLFIFGIAAVAAIIYCSWPLGYLLNPAASRHGLASELGAEHQPYNWLFDGFDVMAGLLVMVVAYLMVRFAPLARIPLARLAIACYGMFGVFTAIDAVVPMRCAPSLRKCPGIGKDRLLVVHGVASIAASVFLLASALLIWQLGSRTLSHHTKMVLYWLIGGWALFGLLSVIFLLVSGPGYLAQHYFITLCSGWMIAFPYYAYRAIDAK